MTRSVFNLRVLFPADKFGGHVLTLYIFFDSLYMVIKELSFRVFLSRQYCFAGFLLWVFLVTDRFTLLFEAFVGWFR